MVIRIRSSARFPISYFENCSKIPGDFTEYLLLLDIAGELVDAD